MTIPNFLTFGRILLTPVLVWLVLQDRLTTALFVFFVAGMSDALDGFIARFFDQKSRLGAFMDPLADKILLVTLFVVLSYIGLIPLWLLVITMGRDLMIVSGFLALHLSGVKVEMRPIGASKATTFFQLTTIFIVLGSKIISLPGWGYMILFLVTAAFSIYSGYRYVVIGLSLLRESRGSTE